MLQRHCLFSLKIKKTYIHKIAVIHHIAGQSLFQAEMPPLQNTTGNPGITGKIKMDFLHINLRALPPTDSKWCETKQKVKT